MHENVPRLDISLTKKSHDLQICTRPTCRCILSDGIRKKKINTGSDKLVNSAFFGKNINGVYKFEKKYFWLENIFLRKPSPRILRHVGRVCKFEGRGIFYKRDIQPRGISAKVPKAADWHFIITYTLYI